MIEYLDHHGNDNVVANSARVSMTEIEGAGWLNLPEDYNEAQRDRLITYLAKHGHLTPFRHNSVSIRCKVPIFLARQLGKHQAGLSWNEISRRYVDTTPSFFSPSAWRSRPDKSIKQGSGGVHAESKFWQASYDKFVDQALELYEAMLSDSVAPEMARMILPQSMMIEYVWTGNILAFAHVYKLRAGEGAQQEAKDFAKELDEIIRPLFPVSWAALVDGE